MSELVCSSHDALQVCVWTGCTEWVETWLSYRNYALLSITVGPCFSSLSLTVNNYDINVEELVFRWFSLVTVVNCFAWRVCLCPDETVSLADGKWEDIHVTTGALKMYFRELPEPLFTYSLFHDFVNAISTSCASHFIYLFIYLFMGSLCVNCVWVKKWVVRRSTDQQRIEILFNKHFVLQEVHVVLILLI